ncbi:hypothetical protein DFH09DRAFT_1339456 [Mycena vulgaris]|nr:hypothetical protein DFH09DRAFT_1339456 [Mycena vulgaris]
MTCAVAGTPGRILDLVQEGKERQSSRVNYLVLDEADRNHHTGAGTGNAYNLSQYAQDVVHGNKFSDVVFTFGALNLGNYPAAMLDLRKPGAPNTIDMGAIDVLRDRDRGVPGYIEFRGTLEFRRLFSLIPAKTMDDISDDKAVVAALRSVYGEDVESVDLLPGSPRARA